MKKKDTLYDLIKSLTKNEKRFFKIYASRHTIGGKNNYIKIFETIDKLNKYDDKKLRSKIKSESFLKHLSVAKNYLYNLILECLDIYHKDSSIDRQISKHINIARVLSEKRLDEQSVKVIEKAKRLSERYNRFENMIALSSIQKNIGFDRDTISAEELKTYHNDLLSAEEKLKVKREFNKIRDELLIQRRRKGPAKNEQELLQLKTFYDNPYFRDFSKINSLDANIYYLLAKIEYSRILRDKKMGRTYTLKLISVFDLHVSRIADNINQYIYVLNVFIVERLYMNNRNEANKILKKIISIPSLIEKKAVTNDVRVKIFEVYHTCVTDIALAFRDYASALPHIQKAEKELRKYERQMTPSFNLVLKSNIACIYFGAGHYKQALQWCNVVINDAPQYREDMFYTVRILNLITHFELGNQLILPSLIKSTYRYLYKRQRVYKFENIFLKYLRLFLRAETKNEQQLLFTQFKTELVPLIENKLENLIFNDIDIIAWIDRKII